MTDAASAPARGRRTIAAHDAVLAVVIGLGAALRASRLFHAGYFGDEWFEILARKAVLEHGVPELPSGQIWPYGGILLWPGALGTAIGDLSVFWNRLPMFLIATAAIWAVARAASRRLGPWAGVAAAAAVALHAGHVEWSAHVKVYGAMTLFTALALDRWIAWVLEDDARAARGFSAWTTAAALVHPAAAFVLAGFGCAGLAAGGLRWARRPSTWAAFAAPVAALAIFAWIMRTYDPVMADIAAAPQRTSDRSPAVVLVKQSLAALRSHGWRSAWHAVPFALAAAGSAIAAVRLVRGRGRERASPERIAVAAFAVWLVAMLGLTHLSRHGGSMYLLPAYPALALAAAAGATVVAANGRGVALALAAVAPVAHVAVTRPAWASAFDARAGTARVLAHFGADCRPGDVSFGAGPIGPLLSRGVVPDSMVFGANFGASSVVRDGVRVDRLFGRPLLTTLADVRSAFEAAPRVWFFVSDREVEAGRVSPDVRDWLASRMTLVDESDGLSLYVGSAR